MFSITLQNGSVIDVNFNHKYQKVRRKHTDRRTGKVTEVDAELPIGTLCVIKTNDPTMFLASHPRMIEKFDRDISGEECIVSQPPAVAENSLVTKEMPVFVSYGFSFPKEDDKFVYAFGRRQAFMRALYRHADGSSGMGTVHVKTKDGVRSKTVINYNNCVLPRDVRKLLVAGFDNMTKGKRVSTRPKLTVVPTTSAEETI